MSNRTLPSLLFFLVLYAIPLIAQTLIMRLHWTPFGLDEYGRYFLVLVGVAAFYAYKRRYRLDDLGLSREGLGASLAVNVAFSLGMLALITALFYYNPISTFRTPHLPAWNNYYTTYILLYCPAQEFIFRSLAFAELKRAEITKPWLLISLTAIPYAFAHILFWNAYTVVITLLIGLAWGAIYQKYPSFWGLALSHAFLGTITIATGLL